MRALFAPRSVAIVGASAQAGSLGQRLLSNVVGRRYGGPIYPINPRYEQLQGLACYPSVAAVPETVNCAAFAVSDDRIEAALADAGAAGVRGAVVYGRLYEPPGAKAPPRPQRVAAIAQAAGMAMCGGNCMGFINTHAGLTLSGNPPPIPDRPGRIAIVSHSGSTWSGLVGNQRNLDVTYAISAGQELAGTLADHIEFILDDDETRAIGLVLETIRDAEGFARAAARAEAKGVPIVALKLGRSEMGRRFALAHSGALAGSAEIYQAYFERLNIPICTTLDQMTDTLELLSCRRAPTHGGLGAATDSGAERQLVVDLAADLGCEIATLTSATEAKLAGILDPGMSTANPVDVFGDGKMVLQECLEAIAADESVGIVAAVTNLVPGRAYLASATDAVERASAGTKKPLLVLGNLHSTVSREAAARLRDRDIPVLMGTATGLHAIRAALTWHRKRAEAHPPAEAAPARLAAEWHARLKAGQLDPVEGLAMFKAFGGPVAPDARAENEGEALAAAERLGFPLVLKTANPEVAHKTEAGGVVLGIGDAAALAQAYRRIALSCGPLMHLQKQAPDGVEIFLGIVGDPQLGPVMTLGLGGLFVEVFRDVVTAIPPVSAQTAHQLLRRLRAYPLLTGTRGRPPLDLDRLCEAVAAFSRLAAALGEDLGEFDVNPLICGSWGAMAVDALVVTKELRDD